MKAADREQRNVITKQCAEMEKEFKERCEREVKEWEDSRPKDEAEKEKDIALTAKRAKKKAKCPRKRHDLAFRH